MKVTIKKGTMNLTVDRSELVEIADTHDGMVFNFKGGVHLYNTDPNMSLQTKGLIRAADGFPKGDIVIDLANYQKPATVNIS
jgi:hypothetical protein